MKGEPQGWRADLPSSRTSTMAKVVSLASRSARIFSESDLADTRRRSAMVVMVRTEFRADLRNVEKSCMKKRVRIKQSLKFTGQRWM